MSNRFSKGRARAGSFAQDVPGDAFGGIAFTAAGTTAVVTSFKFPIGAVIEDVAVKATTTAAAQTISFGLATGASSGGVGTVLINALAIGTTGTYLACASTSHPTLAFTYGSYLVSSTSGAATVLRRHVVGSTDTYQYLTFTCATTDATAGTIYPIFYELM